MKVFVILKNCGILPVNSYSGHKFLHDRSFIVLFIIHIFFSIFPR